MPLDDTHSNLLSYVRCKNYDVVILYYISPWCSQNIFSGNVSEIHRWHSVEKFTDSIKIILAIELQKSLTEQNTRLAKVQIENLNCLWYCSCKISLLHLMQSDISHFGEDFKILFALMHLRSLIVSYF